MSLSIHDVSTRSISNNLDQRRFKSYADESNDSRLYRLSSAVIGRTIDSQLASFLDRMDTGYASFSMFRRTEAKRSSLAVGIQLTFTFLVGTQGYS